jgi:hypothetical protein
MRLAPLIVSVLALAASLEVSRPRPAEACPSCAAGREARGQVMGDDFGFHLFAATLPFLAIGTICVVIERVGR